MKTKRIIRLLSVIITFSLLCSCIEASKKPGSHDITASSEKPKGIQSNVSKEFKTKTGKTIMISETHPVGQSLSTIKISTKDFEYNYSGIYKDRDPITDNFLSDLDGKGFDEIYIIITSPGSGSYGTVLGFVSNKDKSLSMINFPEVQEGDIHFKGYIPNSPLKIRRKLRFFFPNPKIQSSRHLRLKS